MRNRFSGEEFQREGIVSAREGGRLPTVVQEEQRHRAHRPAEAFLNRARARTVC
jgi:hypothetical protein